MYVRALQTPVARQIMVLSNVMVVVVLLLLAIHQISMLHVRVLLTIAEQ
jgi:hypothetical protein